MGKQLFIKRKNRKLYTVNCILQKIKYGNVLENKEGILV